MIFTRSIFRLTEKIVSVPVFAVVLHQRRQIMGSKRFLQFYSKTEMSCVRLLRGEYISSFLALIIWDMWARLFACILKQNPYQILIWRSWGGIVAIAVAENTSLGKWLIDRVNSIQCYFCNRSAIKAKFSFSPLRVQADTRRFDFRTF